VTVVIPAYNEAGRVTRVIDVVASVPSVGEVIVVDDGSADDTFAVVEAHPAAQGKDAKVRALRQPANRGKGAAMRAGADAALDADILMFLDADLIGLTVTHVEALAAPVLSGDYDMALGVFRGGRGLTTIAQVLSPNISGQRAIRRNLFLSIPCVTTSGYGVELAVTNHVLREGYRMRKVVLRDVTHPMKEEKLGFWRGAWSRVKMYRQMTPYLLAGTFHRWKRRRR
jgi:glycosyltransferase involved in cell wall biosynthesis